MAEEFREEKTKDLPATPTTPLHRPLREKKPVKIFEPSIIRESPKEFIIEQGKGTQLKNIPNVAYKLSKFTRGDEMLETIHNLLYGRRGKAYYFKRDVLQFSGFVWGEEEENILKGKLKLKEKLHKMKKDDLWRVCDVMDLGVSKYGKKEEMVYSLIEFLEVPCEVGKEKGICGEIKNCSKKWNKSDGKNEEIQEEDEEEKEDEDGDEEEIKGKKVEAKSCSRRRKKNDSNNEENGGIRVEDCEMKVEEENAEGKHIGARIPFETIEQNGLNKEGDEEKEEAEDIVQEGKEELTMVVPMECEEVKKGESNKIYLEKSNIKETIQRMESDEDSLESIDMDSLWYPPTKEIIQKVKIDILKEEKGNTSNEIIKSTKTNLDSEYPSNLEIKLSICKVLENADFENGKLRDVIVGVCQQFNLDHTKSKEDYLGSFLVSILQRVVDKQEEEEGKEDDENGVVESTKIYEEP